jgi:hypothetical protein
MASQVSQAERESYYIVPQKNSGSGSIYTPPSTKPAASKTIAEASRNGRARREGSR